MYRKSVVCLIGCVVIFLTSLCWADGPPFPKRLRDLRAHANTVRAKTLEVETLANRLRELAVEIENLSNMIEFPDQKAKIDRLRVKSNRYEEWIADLEYKTSVLRGLAAKVHQESRMLTRKPPQGVGKCGVGKVWIPRQKSPSGKWVPGHCAPY